MPDQPMQPQILTIPSVQQQVAASFSAWLFSQDKLAVFALILSGGMFAFGGYVAIWVAPGQMAEIRKGYERIEASHVEERKAAEDRHREHFAEIMRKWDDTVARLEKVTASQATLIEKLVLHEVTSK